MIKKSALKVYNCFRNINPVKIYLVLSLASGFFFVNSLLFSSESKLFSSESKIESTNIISEYKGIEKKLNNLYYLYEQPVKIKNLVNSNYFDSLKTLENKLLFAQDSIKSLPSYDIELVKYHKSKRDDYMQSFGYGAKFFGSLFATAVSFSAFIVSLSYKKKKLSK